MTEPILHNIRILDFTWVLAGPYATRLLADFGAEVIKVQPLLPPEADDAFSRGYYQTWNRNKLGITLNLNRPEGVALVKRLVSVCDAVVENFAPRVMPNWGLDFESLRAVKPDILMLSLSVAGQTGPWRDYTGYGPTVQALSGLTGLTVFPGGPPLGPGFSYADHIAGLYASLALLGALEYRRRTGEGQHIDVSQLEAMTSLLGGSFAGGDDSGGAAPYGVYPCRGEDRWCALAVFTDAEWQGFRRALGDPPWGREERFATVAGRQANREALDGLVAAWTKQHNAAEAMSWLQENGVAAGVVQNAADLAGDPHLKGRGFFFDIIHPEHGKVASDAAPVRLSEAPAAYLRAAPSPGEDNACVYRQLLGMSEEEVAALQHGGII
jgi:crotonobetainyl-CoA:carnitine CoA-transferase CaiB-like acyl-CoA transferase